MTGKLLQLILFLTHLNYSFYASDNLNFRGYTNTQMAACIKVNFEIFTFLDRANN